MPRTRRKTEKTAANAQRHAATRPGGGADLETLIARQYLILKEACGQIGDLRKQVDDLETRLDKTQSWFDALMARSAAIDAIEKRVNELALGVNGIGGHLGRLEKRVDAMEKRNKCCGNIAWTYTTTPYAAPHKRPKKRGKR